MKLINVIIISILMVSCENDNEDKKEPLEIIEKINGSTISSLELLSRLKFNTTPGGHIIQLVKNSITKVTSGFPYLTIYFEELSNDLEKEALKRGKIDITMRDETIDGVHHLIIANEETENYEIIYKIDGKIAHKMIVSKNFRSGFYFNDKNIGNEKTGVKEVYLVNFRVYQNSETKIDFKYSQNYSANSGYETKGLLYSFSDKSGKTDLTRYYSGQSQKLVCLSWNSIGFVTYCD